MNSYFLKLVGILLILIFTSCFSDPKIEFSQNLNQRFIKNSLSKFYLEQSDFNLKGNVRCMLEFPILADTILKNQPFPEIESVDTLAKLTRQGMKSEEADFFQFNENGQVLRQVGLSFGSYDEVYVNSYDSKGNITAIDEFDVTLRRTSYKRFKYDAKSKLSEFTSKNGYSRFVDISEISYEEEFMIIRSKNHLDSTEIEEFNYKNGEFIDLSATYLEVKKEYDSKGNIVKSQWPDYSDDTILYHTIIKEYNENDQVVRQINYNIENELDRVETFLYDEKGRLLQRVEMENGKSRIEQYNGDGHVFYSSYHNYNVDSSNYFLHDLRNTNIFGDQHCSVHLYKSEKDTLQKKSNNFQYEYDDHGNWVVKREYTNDSFSGTKGRIIWYQD